jgi:hypothetical protein
MNRYFIISLFHLLWGVRGRVVKVVDFKPTTCPSPLWVGIPTWTLDSFMWGSYPASLRNVGGSTQVPVRAWNKARTGTWGLPPPVKLERRDMTNTVSMWRKTQDKKKKNWPTLCRCEVKPKTNKEIFFHLLTVWYQYSFNHYKDMPSWC